MRRKKMKEKLWRRKKKKKKKSLRIERGLREAPGNSWEAAGLGKSARQA